MSLGDAATGQGTRRKRRRSSAASSQGNVEELFLRPEAVDAPATESAPKRRQKEDKPRVVKGIRCQFCQASDGDKDPVFPEKMIDWAYPEDAEGIVHGDTCGYCNKVFNARFKLKYKTIKNFKPLYVKPGSTEKENFDQWRTVCVDKCKKAGKTASVRITTKDCDEAFAEVKVRSKRKASVMLEAPVDEVWPAQDYIDQFTHWSTNGRGHKYGTFEGITGVMVPGRQVHKIRRMQGYEAEKETLVDDGIDSLGQDQQDANFEALMDQMMPSSAVGVSLNTMIGGLGSSGQPSSSNSGSRVLADASTPQKSTPEKKTPRESSPFGLRMHIEVDDTVKDPAQDGSAEGATPTTRRRKGKQATENRRDRSRSPRQVRPAKGSPATVARTATQRTAPGQSLGKKAVGRPQQNAPLVGEQQIAAWRQATDTDTTFFGEGLKVHRDFLMRTKKLIEQRMQSTTDVEEVKKNTIIFKQLTGIGDLQYGYVKHGAASASFAAIFARFRMYCEQEPATPLVAPDFMWRGCYEHDIVESKPHHFWEMLTESAMLIHKFEQDELEVAVKKMIKDKILNITAATDVLENMQKLFPRGRVGPTYMSKESQEEIWSLGFVVNFVVTDDVEKLRRAAEIIECKTRTMANALLCFKGGKAILLLAREKSKLQTSIDEHLAAAVKELKLLIAKFPDESSTDGFSRVAGSLSKALGSIKDGSPSGDLKHRIRSEITPLLEELAQKIKATYTEIYGPAMREIQVNEFDAAKMGDTSHDRFGLICRLGGSLTCL